MNGSDILSFGLCKKIKFGAKNKAVVRHVLSFLHRQQKLSFFLKTVRTHIDCQDLHAIFFC
jgi:hypothetical protein